MANKIGVLGCGNMGGALVKGLCLRDKASKVYVYDKNRKKTSYLKRKYKVKSVLSLQDLLSSVNILILAVKPQDTAAVLNSLKNIYQNQLVISIVAGVSIRFIEKVLGGNARVVRVMPNLAAIVSDSVSVVAKGKYARAVDLRKAEKIFQSVGSCLMLKEKYINSVTAVSGSGPGYIYYFLLCLQEAALKLGFTSDQASFLVVNTLRGAANLISDKDDLAKMVNKVSSKGGTTESALKYFKSKKLKSIVVSAVNRAKQRADALGK